MKKAKLYIGRKLIKFAFWLMRDKNPNVFVIRMATDINGGFYGTTHSITRTMAPATRMQLQENMVEMSARIVKDLEQGWMR